MVPSSAEVSSCVCVVITGVSTARPEATPWEHIRRRHHGGHRRRGSTRSCSPRRRSGSPAPQHPPRLSDGAPMVRIHRHAGAKDLVDGGAVFWRIGLSVDTGRHQRLETCIHILCGHRVRLGHQGPSRHEEDHHGTQRVDVRLVRCRGTQKLLWCRVLRRADEGARSGHCTADPALDLCDSKVRYPYLRDCALLRLCPKQEVLRLEIAVNDALRMSLCRAKQIWCPTAAVSRTPMVPTRLM